jgi:hypothetical protein
MTKRPTLPSFHFSNFAHDVFGEDMHVKRVESLAACMEGAFHAARLGVAAIGLALAQRRGLEPKHAVKQVDRLLSNRKLDVWALFADWVPYVVGLRSEIRVALDWTDYDADGQTTICLHLLTRHGRATPLVWLTVMKDDLATRRNEYEDRVLYRLSEVVPAGVRVTVVADRGFGDTALYAFLATLHFDYVVRFRECIVVEDAQGTVKRAGDWVGPRGRATMLKGVHVTGDRAPVPAVVCVKEKGMKDSWCLATSLGTATARDVVNMYGKRFTIEEGFRDTKDLHFGMGLSATPISQPARRDRMLLIAALAIALLTLLGAAGEHTGLDRRFRSNTVKTRTHSLFNQGWMYYGALPTMREEWAIPLLRTFHALVASHRLMTTAFGIV